MLAVICYCLATRSNGEAESEHPSETDLKLETHICNVGLGKHYKYPCTHAHTNAHSDTHVHTQADTPLISLKL